MKKFKLIKTYPNSPQLGHVIEQLKNNKNEDINYYYNEWLNPSKYPELWQEIVNKEYDALLLKCLEDYEIFDNKSIVNKLEQILKDGYIIYSIKRLSDGEIFTVGDLIEKEVVIGKFKIGLDDKIWVETEPNYYDSIPLNSLSKFKQPLFTTEDGVEIFEGDTYYELNPNYDKYGGKKYWKYDITKESLEEIEYSIELIGCERFSTKEKAEEYILINKPCLSIKEIAPIFGQMHLDNSITVLDRMTEKLTNLVKTKL